jgi:hypothetical protein
MRQVFQITTTTFLLACPVYGFTADLTLAEKNRALERFVISDLTVGDSAFLDTYALCWDEDQLKVNGSHEVGEQSSTSFTLKVTRVPGGSFEAEFAPPDSISADDREQVIDDLYYTGECSLLGAWIIKFESFFPVLSINGKSTVSELIEVIKTLGADQ